MFLALIQCSRPDVDLTGGREGNAAGILKPS
jgi:hypothetical protein